MELISGCRAWQHKYLELLKFQDYERNWYITRYCLDVTGGYAGLLDATGIRSL